MNMHSRRSRLRRKIKHRIIVSLNKSENPAQQKGGIFYTCKMSWSTWANSASFSGQVTKIWVRVHAITPDSRRYFMERLTASGTVEILAARNWFEWVIRSTGRAPFELKSRIIFAVRL